MCSLTVGFRQWLLWSTLVLTRVIQQLWAAITNNLLMDRLCNSRGKVIVHHRDFFSTLRLFRLLHLINTVTYLLTYLLSSVRLSWANNQDTATDSHPVGDENLFFSSFQGISNGGHVACTVNKPATAGKTAHSSFQASVNVQHWLEQANLP